MGDDGDAEDVMADDEDDAGDLYSHSHSNKLSHIGAGGKLSNQVLSSCTLHY